MAIRATVRSWHADDGWGVLDAPQLPGGCWAHFSAVAVAGYRSLRPGEPVHLQYEAVEQDGYPYRAVRVWPDGRQPTATASDQAPGAYRSELTLRFDDADPPSDGQP